MNISLKTPYGFSEVGKNNTNEDFIYPKVGEATPDDKLFIVCDGIGGPIKGTAASEIVGTAFKKYFTETNPPLNKKVGQLYVNEALRYAERKMFQHIQSYPAKRGMLSSIALVYFSANNTVTLAWAGIARAYHIRGKQILYKTEDHFITLREGGKNTTVPRAISGIDPVWASTTIIKQVQAGDYFVLLTHGVRETFDERNLKYLLSQGDEQNSTNEAIVSKMKELCVQNSRSDASMYLVQVGEGNVARDYSDAPPLAKEGEITTPKKIQIGSLSINTGRSNTAKRKTPSAVINEDSNISSNKAILIALFIMLVVASALAYKFTTSSPEELFSEAVSKGDTYIAQRDYKNAIASFQEALTIEISDTSDFPTLRQKVANAKTQQLVYEGDALFRNKKLVKARQKYQAVLLINPQNGPIRQKVDFITNELANQKYELVANADTLLQKQEYEEAKKLLYEALYIDQKDENTLKQLNVCNVGLEQQTMSLAEAVVRAVRFDSLGYEIDNQAPDNIAEVDPDTTTTNGEKPEDIAAVVEDPKTVKPPPTKKIPTKVVPPPTKVITPTKTSPYDKLFAEAEAAFDAGNFPKAKAKYKEAMKYGGDKTDLEKKIEAADAKVASKEYDKHIKSADFAYTNSNFEEAKKYYELALNANEKDDYAKKRIAKINEKISEAENQTKQYNQILSEADQAFRQGNYSTAKSKYSQALKYTSNVTSINKKIAECDRAITQMAGESSRKKVKKAEKVCKSSNYNGECYAHLRENSLLYSFSPKLLYKLGQNLEARDASKARECYTIAAGKNYAPAKEKLK
ncbi:MAG: hypothetical protein ACPG5B_12470 [Chitinophagales bacterium]